MVPDPSWRVTLANARGATHRQGLRIRAAIRVPTKALLNDRGRRRERSSAPWSTSTSFG